MVIDLSKMKKNKQFPFCCQIVSDQQVGQKIQIVTAMNPSSIPKQQFFLTTADGSGAGKVILASPDSNHNKQLIFTAADNLMPGRIQVHMV